jgi:hypothetical protein
VVEAGHDQFLDQRLRQPDSRRDQVAIETDRGAVADDLGKVAPARRLAAGQMHVQHTKGGSLDRTRFQVSVSSSRSRPSSSSGLEQ